MRYEYDRVKPQLTLRVGGNRSGATRMESG